MASLPVEHHLALSGGPTEMLVDWGHRTTLISSPERDLTLWDTLHDQKKLIGAKN